jgi:hypothetical protein
MTSPTAWEWVVRGERNAQDYAQWIAHFQIGNVSYKTLFEYDDDLNYWVVSFNASARGMTPTTLKTGTGNAHAVYSTVIDIAAAFAKENTAAACLVIYSAEEEGAPRYRVNRFIAQKIAARIGWKFEMKAEKFQRLIQNEDYGEGFYIMKDGWQFPE